MILLTPTDGFLSRGSGSAARVEMSLFLRYPGSQANMNGYVDGNLAVRSKRDTHGTNCFLITWRSGTDVQHISVIYNVVVAGYGDNLNEFWISSSSVLLLTS